MSKHILKSLELFISMILLSCGLYIPLAEAGSGLNLEVIKQCDIKYAGDSCAAELKLTNSTGETMDGEAILSVEYQDEPFDGEGIYAWYDDASPAGEWNDGQLVFSGFEIPGGESQTRLRIQTHPALCPGEYSFALSVKGFIEEEEYTTPPVVIGGGGYIPPEIPTETPETEPGEVTATPDEGGRAALTNPDGSMIELIIPAGAVSEDTRFTIEAVDISSISQPDPARGLFLIAGLVFEIRAERDGEYIAAFDRPLTLTFTYTDEQIGELDESSLEIHYWDANQNQWVALENSEVDAENNTVSASIDHLTLFGLAGSKIRPVEGEIKEAEEGETPAPIAPGKEKEGEIVKPEEIAEGPTEVSPTAAEKPQPEEERMPVEAEGVPVRTPQEGPASVLAAIGMTWRQISQSVFLTIAVILCLVILVFIGAREWRLFRRKSREW